jgi:hypothetical protein
MPHKDPEERRKYFKEYNRKRREKHRVYSNKWYHEHKEFYQELRRHNKEKEPWISHYYSARTRCLNPKVKDFYRYGGKGIKFLLTKTEVRELWFRDRAYLMKKPSIDREDAKGNYEFGNCRFIEFVKNCQRARRKGEDLV